MSEALQAGLGCRLGAVSGAIVCVADDRQCQLAAAEGAVCDPVEHGAVVSKAAGLNV